MRRRRHEPPIVDPSTHPKRYVSLRVAAATIRACAYQLLAFIGDPEPFSDESAACASPAGIDPHGWQPIERLDDPDREVLMWTPVENLYLPPYSPTMRPTMRVSSKRYWTWASHFCELPPAPEPQP